MADAICLHGPWDPRLTGNLGMKQQRVVAILDGDRVHAGDIPAETHLISCDDTACLILANHASVKRRLRNAMLLTSIHVNG